MYQNIGMMSVDNTISKSNHPPALRRKPWGLYLSQRIEPMDIKQIESAMSVIMIDWGKYDQIVMEYDKLLEVMGNVDGNEVVALVLLAACNCNALDGIGPSNIIPIR